MASNASSFEQLASLRRRLQELGLGLRAKPIVAANKAIVAVSLTLIKRGFLGETDPYGKHWAPLKDQKARHSILVKTRKMMLSWRGETTFSGIRLTNRAPYVSFHQDGTDTIPVRRMIPANWGQLPPMWAKAWNRVAMEVLERYARL